MGGGAFLTARGDGLPTLQTPRMSEATYARLENIYNQRLSAYFGKDSIVTLIEAPGKKDYGDIDIFVAHTGTIDWDRVASAVGAVAWLDRGSDKSQKCSLAVRLDGERSSGIPSQYVFTHKNNPREQQPSSVMAEEVLAQLDLEKIAPEDKEWSAYYGSYGDLAGMLGYLVTNLGLSITDRGLRLRLKELDECGRGDWGQVVVALEEGRMLLSSDSVKIMEFFGLDVARYAAGFKTEEQLFHWLGECRLISEHSIKLEVKETARDRQKAGRPMFQRFFRAFLPAHLEAKGLISVTAEGETQVLADKASSLSDLRKQYLQEALEFFDKSKEYETLHAALLRNRANQIAMLKIRSMLIAFSQKKGSALAELVRAFRRNVSFRDGQPFVLDQPRTDTDSELYTFVDQSGKQLQDQHAVELWVQANFDRVKEVERARMKRVVPDASAGTSGGA